jgi:hypothetical protein
MRPGPLRGVRSRSSRPLGSLAFGSPRASFPGGLASASLPSRPPPLPIRGDPPATAHRRAWSVPDLNRLLSPCKDEALPLELTPRSNGPEGSRTLHSIPARDTRPRGTCGPNKTYSFSASVLLLFPPASRIQRLWIFAGHTNLCNPMDAKGVEPSTLALRKQVAPTVHARPIGFESEALSVFETPPSVAGKNIGAAPPCLEEPPHLVLSRSRSLRFSLGRVLPCGSGCCRTENDCEEARHPSCS